MSRHNKTSHVKAIYRRAGHKKWEIDIALDKLTLLTSTFEEQVLEVRSERKIKCVALIGYEVFNSVVDIGCEHDAREPVGQQGDRSKRL